MSANKIDARQSELRSALDLIGSSTNSTLDTIFPKINDALTKLYEDRNILLAEGGLITFTGTTVTFSAALKLHVNSKEAGGTPTVIDLGSTTRNVVTDGDMIYATIDRSLGTAIITDNSATLPAVNSANQEVFLIAKRVGTRIYFINGMSLSSSESSLLGSSGANTSLSNLTTTSINQSLLPDTPFTRNIGSSSDVWKEIHAESLNVLESAGTPSGALTGSDGTTPSGSSSNFRLTSGLGLSGPLSIHTLNNSVPNSNSTADIEIDTGNKTAGSGDSGSIKLRTGTVNTGTRGRIELDARTIGLDARLASDPSGSFNPSEIYFNTTVNKFKYYDGTVWKELGSGTGTGINYIEGGDAESGTTGWTTYDDGDVAVPVDGTGDAGGAGDNTLTFSTTSVTPLRGLNSFLLSKTAASGRGEGASYDFTIDDADKAKVLSISFDYEIASGTYADGDLTVYIYDVTNDTVIQPAGFSIQNVGIESKHVATFQTASNSTSYRLIFHVASVSTSAWSLKLDNIVVGPQSVTHGDVFVDEFVFNSSGITGAGASDTTSFATGESGAAIGSINSTTASGASVTVMLVQFSDEIRSTDELTIELQGTSTTAWMPVPTEQIQPLTYQGNAVYGVGLNRVTTSSRQMRIAFGNAGRISNGGTYAVAAQAWGDISAWRWRVRRRRILKNVQMSSDTDTRVVAARFHTTATQSTTGSYTTNIVKYTTRSYDTHGAYDPTTGFYTVKVPGRYAIAGTFITPGDTAVDFYACSVKNGGVVKQLHHPFGVATTVGYALHIYDEIECNAGDTLAIGFIYGGATTYNILAVSANSAVLSISKIGGASAIAVSEKIVALAGNAAGTTIGTSATLVPFATITTNTHGALAADGTFTAPRPDFYTISALLTTQSVNLNTGQQFLVDVFKNGAHHRHLGRSRGTGASVNHAAGGTTVVYLLAGETLSIRAASDVSVGLFASAAYNHVSITSGGTP